MMYTFFEKKYLPICDTEVLRSLGADDLLYNSKINIADYFSDDIDVLKRRSIVFGDALNVRGLYELLVSISQKLSAISDVLRSESEIGERERSIFSAKQLELYLDIFLGMRGSSFRIPPLIMSWMYRPSSSSSSMSRYNWLASSSLDLRRT